MIPKPVPIRIDALSFGMKERIFKKKRRRKDSLPSLFLMNTHFIDSIQLSISVFIGA